MKPPTLVLLFSPDDARAYLSINNEISQPIIFASGLDTLQILQSAGIPFRPFKHYLTVSQVKKNYRLARKLASYFDQTIFSSVRTFFLELLRSHLIIKQLIEKFKPNMIVVSDALNENMYCKYHGPTFNLLPPVTIAFCQQNNIPVKILFSGKSHEYLTISLFNLISSKIIQYLNYQRLPQIPVSGKKNLVFSASNYHLINLKNLINTAKSKWNIIVLGKWSEKEKQELSGSKVYLLDSTKFIFSFGSLLTLGKSILKNLLIRSPKQHRQLKQYLYKLLKTDYWKIIQLKINYWQLILIPENASLSFFFAKFFETYNPSAIVTSNSLDNFNRTLHLSAKLFSVKDMVILHYPLMTEIDTIEEQSGIESILFTSGKESIKLFNQHPISSKVIALGLPVYDKYIIRPEPEKLIPKPNIKILFLLVQAPLYLANPFEQEIYETMQELVKLSFSNIQVTLRCHPHQPKPKIDYSQFPFPIRVVENTPLIEELLNHQIIISHQTSAAIDAMIQRKPLIYLNIYSTINVRLKTVRKTTIEIHHLKQVVKIIESITQNPDKLITRQNQFLDRVIGTIDGKASSRIINFLGNELKID